MACTAGTMATVCRNPGWNGPISTSAFSERPTPTPSQALSSACGILPAFELVQPTVHDLRSNVFGVEIAARLPGRPDNHSAERNELAALINDRITSVTATLQEWMELARLDAKNAARPSQR